MQNSPLPTRPTWPWPEVCLGLPGPSWLWASTGRCRLPKWLTALTTLPAKGPATATAAHCRVWKELRETGLLPALLITYCGHHRVRVIMATRVRREGVHDKD